MTERYNLRIFYDLEQKRKLNAIQWCMKKGLITASAECSVCKKAMQLIKKKSSDGYIWECQKRGANGQRIKRSVRKNSWFLENKLNMLEILKLKNMWCERTTMTLFLLNLMLRRKQSWIG
ncbi:UNVERIFIED_CONTAM: hypothetical protein NCL1_55037 [Trichonephila clavipes]